MTSLSTGSSPNGVHRVPLGLASSGNWLHSVPLCVQWVRRFLSQKLPHSALALQNPKKLPYFCLGVEVCFLLTMRALRTKAASPFHAAGSGHGLPPQHCWGNSQQRGRMVRICPFPVVGKVETGHSLSPVVLSYTVWPWMS